MDGIIYFIYKHSDNPFISVIIFMGIEFFTLSFTALRQMIAVAIVINSYSFIKEKKPIKFILLVLIASLFHKTAIIFLIAYFFRYISINKKTIIIAFVTLLIIQIIGFDIIIAVARKIYPYYIPETIIFSKDGIVQAMLILFYFIIGLYLYYFQINEKDRKEDIILYGIMFTAFFIQSFTNRIPMLNRLMWYFYIFVILFLPNLIEKVKNNKIKKIAYSGVVFLNLIQFLFSSMQMYNIIPYEFFIK